MRDPLTDLEKVHAEQEQMCTDLEKVADSLPDNADRLLCAHIARMMQEDMPLHHLDEEIGLFPLLEKRAQRQDNVAAHLAQLKLEHETDEGFADELIECLLQLAEGGKLDNPDMCGYMMRGFFESYRRHIHWEQTVLIPLARKRLEHGDLETLVQVMKDNREGKTMARKAG